MGLDQYAYFLNQGDTHGWECDDEGEFLDEDTPSPSEDFYWRKHNRLEGFMAELHHQKTGEPKVDKEGYATFGCTPLELTKEDLELLSETISNRELPQTSGFFFGADSYDEYDDYLAQKDAEFLAGAFEALEQGKRVIYVSSW